MCRRKVFCLVARGSILCLLKIISLKHLQSGIPLVACVMGSVLCGSFPVETPIASCSSIAITE